MAVNDSGVAVPAMAIGVAMPYATAVSVRALRLEEFGSSLGDPAADGGTSPQPPPDGTQAGGTHVIPVGGPSGGPVGGSVAGAGGPGDVGGT